MILVPLGTRVLIKRKNITKVGGILVPRGSQEAKVCIGEVVATGPDCDTLKEGQLLTFGRYAPMNIDYRELEFYGIEYRKDDDHEYLILNEEDALCIIEKECDDVA